MSCHNPLVVTLVFFKTKCMVMTGDFNQGHHVLAAILEQFQEPAGVSYLEPFQVDQITGYHNPGNPACVS